MGIWCSNFDNVGTAMTTLFELSSLEMWPDIMNMGRDVTSVGKHPELDASLDNSLVRSGKRSDETNEERRAQRGAKQQKEDKSNEERSDDYRCFVASLLAVRSACCYRSYS